MYHQHGLFPSSAGNMMYHQHGLQYYNPTSEFGWNMQPNYDMLRNSSSRIGAVHSGPSIPPIAETGRSFTVIFTSEEEKNVLTRMIHMHMITDHHTKELNLSHVQLLSNRSIFFSTCDDIFSTLRNAGIFSSMPDFSRELFETLRRGAAGRTWLGN